MKLPQQNPPVTELLKKFIDLEKKLKKYEEIIDALSRKNFYSEEYRIGEKIEHDARMHNLTYTQRVSLICSIAKEIDSISELKLSKEDIEYFKNQLIQNLLSSHSCSQESVDLGYALLKLARLLPQIRAELAPFIIMNAWRERGVSGEYLYVFPGSAELHRFIASLTDSELEKLKDIHGLMQIIEAVLKNPENFASSHIDNPEFLRFEEAFVTKGYLGVAYPDKTYFYSHYKQYIYLQNEFVDYLRTYWQDRNKAREIKVEEFKEGVWVGEVSLKDAIEKTCQELGLAPDFITDHSNKTLPNPAYKEIMQGLVVMGSSMMEKDKKMRLFVLDLLATSNMMILNEEQFKSFLTDAPFNGEEKDKLIKLMKHVLITYDRSQKKRILALINNNTEIRSLFENLLVQDVTSFVRDLEVILDAFNSDVAAHTEEIKTIFSALGDPSFFIPLILNGILSEAINTSQGDVHNFTESILKNDKIGTDIKRQLIMNYLAVGGGWSKGILELIKSSTEHSNQFVDYLIDNPDRFFSNLAVILSVFDLDFILNKVVTVSNWNNLSNILGRIPNLLSHAIETEDSSHLQVLSSLLEIIIAEQRLGIDGRNVQIEVAYPLIWQARDRLIPLLFDSRLPPILKRQLRILIRLLPRTIEIGTGASEPNTARRLAVDAETEQMRLSARIQDEIQQRWVNAAHNGNIHGAVHNNPGLDNLGLCEDIINEFQKLGRPQEEYTNLLNLRKVLHAMYRPSIDTFRQETIAWQNQAATSVIGDTVSGIRQNLDKLLELSIEDMEFLKLITQIRDTLSRDIISNGDVVDNVRVATYMLDLYLEILQFTGFAVQLEKLGNITREDFNAAPDLINLLIIALKDSDLWPEGAVEKVSIYDFPFF